VIIGNTGFYNLKLEDGALVRLSEDLIVEVENQIELGSGAYLDAVTDTSTVIFTSTSEMQAVPSLSVDQVEVVIITLF